MKTLKNLQSGNHRAQLIAFGIIAVLAIIAMVVFNVQIPRD